jgi:hypothetical protein
MKALASISSALLSISTGRVALVGLIIFLAFGALVLPGQSAAAEKASAGAGSPDASFFYTPDGLIQQAEAYGQAGRAAYVRARWTFDLAFPLVYGFFLATSISWALRKVAPVGSAWQRLNLLPVAAVAFDYLENTATSLVMARYPAGTPLAAGLAPWMTLLKWVFVYGSFGILFAALVAVLVRRVRRRSE